VVNDFKSTKEVMSETGFTFAKGRSYNARLSRGGCRSCLNQLVDIAHS
jgi:hypothetical protein